MKMKRRLRVILVLLAAALLLGGCGRHEHWMQGNSNREMENKS